MEEEQFEVNDKRTRKCDNKTCTNCQCLNNIENFESRRHRSCIYISPTIWHEIRGLACNSPVLYQSETEDFVSIVQTKSIFFSKTKFRKNTLGKRCAIAVHLLFSNLLKKTIGLKFILTQQKNYYSDSFSRMYWLFNAIVQFPVPIRPSGLFSVVTVWRRINLLYFFSLIKKYFLE